MLVIDSAGCRGARNVRLSRGETGTRQPRNGTIAAIITLRRSNATLGKLSSPQEGGLGEIPAICGGAQTKVRKERSPQLREGR
jgi:hypothetical protein